jgi:hypothetical protein
MDGIPSLWDPKKDRIDKWLKAYTQIIALENQRKNKLERDSHLAKNLMVVLMVAFGITGLGFFS